MSVDKSALTTAVTMVDAKGDHSVGSKEHWKVDRWEIRRVVLKDVHSAAYSVWKKVDCTHIQRLYTSNIHQFDNLRGLNRKDIS